MKEKLASESLEAFIANCSSDQDQCNVGKLALFKVELVAEKVQKKRRRRRLEMEVLKAPLPRLAKEIALKRGRKEVKPDRVRVWSRGTQTCESEVLMLPTSTFQTLVDKVEKMMSCSVPKS